MLDGVIAAAHRILLAVWAGVEVPLFSLCLTSSNAQLSGLAESDATDVTPEAQVSRGASLGDDRLPERQTTHEGDGTHIPSPSSALDVVAREKIARSFELVSEDQS